MKIILFALILMLTMTSQAIRIPKSCKIVASEYIFENAPFKQCHASTIVELKDGSLIAAWFGGTYEGSTDVGLWVSVEKNNLWSVPKEIANGIVNDSLGYPCWNPVFFKSNDGKLSLYYKVGPNPREWWGMVMQSDNEGESWSKPKPLPAGILGPIKNKPIILPSGVILSPSSIETKTEEWHAHIERSTDDGKSWKRFQSILKTLQK